MEYLWVFLLMSTTVMIWQENEEISDLTNVAKIPGNFRPGCFFGNGGAVMLVNINSIRENRFLLNSLDLLSFNLNNRIKEIKILFTDQKSAGFIWDKFKSWQILIKNM